MTDQVLDLSVKNIIDQSLALQALRPRETIVHRVSRSFRALQERRQKVEPLNINLAAAEHYMYARFLAGISGDPAMKLAPSLYGLKKRLYFLLRIQDRMAVTHNPVLPPDNAVERWGTRGASDGLVDYTYTTGRPATNYGAAIWTLAAEAQRYN